MRVAVGIPGRNIRIGGRRTSIRLEDALWDALQVLAAAEDGGVDAVVDAAVANRRRGQSTTSAIREHLVQSLLGRLYEHQPARLPPP
jgi:predicted DNA-binding ribbon-helix-helix protein